MKKFLIFILLSSIFLSSCSIDWNDDKDKKIAELEKQIIDIKKQSEDFKKESMSQTEKLELEIKSYQKNDKLIEKLEDCISSAEDKYHSELANYNQINKLPADYPPLGPPGKSMTDNRDINRETCIRLYK